MIFHKKRIIFFTILLILLNSFSIHASSPIDEVRTLVDRYYVEPVSSDILNEPTIDDILSHLDRYSVFYTADEFEAFMSNINNTYVGIGVSLEDIDRSFMIYQVFPGGSAEEAGVLPNDKIISINDTLVDGMTVDEVVQKISGPEGTTVKIKFYRSSTNEYLTKSLMRKTITIPTVIAERLAGNVGYLAINSFNDNTVPEIEEQLKAYNNVEHWIVDIRNNGGGYLDVAQQVVGKFPNAEVALIEETRYTTQTLKAIKQPSQFTQKVDLLINGYSASASEIMAGALKDSNSAVLYGETTFGKGVMQSIFSLSEGDYLKLTIAKFYTPNHQEIQNVGITPDVYSDTPLVDAHLNWLKQKYYRYKQLPMLDKIKPTKVFNIKFSTLININTFNENTFELIQLGGNKVPVTISQTGFNSIQVKPNSPLIKGEQYLLLMHPGWKSLYGKTNVRGAHVKITVGE